jgi:hypothetical protein
MRASCASYVAAGLLAALTCVAGCGDSNDTNIILGNEPTPTGGVRTATPGGGTATPARTATAGAPTASATPAASGAATPSPSSSGGTPAPTSTASGAISPDVQAISNDLLPFLASTALLTGGSVSALSAGNAPLVRDVATRTSLDALKSDNCPLGGTRVDDEGVPVRTITLDTCDVSAPSLGTFEFDGTVTITLSSLSGGTIDFDVDVTDEPAENQTITFSGTLTLTVQSGNFVLNGPLVISTDVGDFTLTANQLTINSSRKLASGSGAITDDDNATQFQSIQMVVAQGGGSANFTVTFDDNTTHTYTLNLTTGQLTQTS